MQKRCLLEKAFIAIPVNRWTHSLMVFRNVDFDCGTKNGFLQATVAFALERADLRDELYSYLHKVITTRTAAE